MSIAFLLFTIRMILRFQFGFKELEMNNYKQKMNFSNKSLKTVDFRGFLDAFPVDEGQKRGILKDFYFFDTLVCLLRCLFRHM